jgi:hypothetical protein
MFSVLGEREIERGPKKEGITIRFKLDNTRIMRKKVQDT